MSLHKTRSMDALHHILSSFRQFEKKLDKLQDDVSYHGQTLTDLRVMIANLSDGTLYNPKTDHAKACKTTAVHSSHFEKAAKTKRKAVHPLSPPSKVAAKSYQGQKYGIKPSKHPEDFTMKKMASTPKSTLGAKRVQRQRKCEAPRKANPIRPKKVSTKKSKSPPPIFEYPSQFKRPLF